MGSVLIQRMLESGDFDLLQPSFFSTSKPGEKSKVLGFDGIVQLKDARDLKELSLNSVIVSCQGSSFTKETHPNLRKMGWRGYWVDASSELRMNENSTIVLDPLNRTQIDLAIKNGLKDFIGGNCTVSLLLMALHGLIKENLVDWISSMTYQAASGAGARHVKELVSQMGAIYQAGANLREGSVIDLEAKIRDQMLSKAFPTAAFDVPLAGSLIPWIDQDLGNGESKEEWKATAEANRILGNDCNNTLRIEGLCVRVGTLRCHGQALIFKLKNQFSVDELTKKCEAANDWVRVIPNRKSDTISDLSPLAVSGNLTILIGRLRRLSIEDNVYTAFTLGDQLLWGAAEPLRRVLKIIVEGCVK